MQQYLYLLHRYNMIYILYSQQFIFQYKFCFNIYIHISEQKITVMAANYRL